MTDSVSQYAFSTVSPLSEGYTVEELNQRLTTIQENLRSLGSVMEVAHVGSSLLGFNATISSDAEVGFPLYFDTEDKIFRPSRITLMESEGRLLAGPESEAWVLLLNKCDAVRGTVLFDGLATVDLTASAGESSPSGKLYLGREPGELVTTPEGMIVPVLLATGNGEVLFRPWFADTFPRYFPKLIPLSPNPAGTAASVGEGISFSSTDLSQPGWLPATNGIFGGHRPVGAMLGYNWSADPNLVDIWPPLQPGECELLIDTGGAESRGYRVLPGNSNDRVLITEHGIWWMSPCWSHAPWVAAAEGQTGQTSCPKSFPRKLVLRADFANVAQVAASEVSALRSKIDWLKVFKKNTSALSAVGELDLAVDPSLLFGQLTDADGLAIKNYTSGKFTRGPVVGSITAKSPAIIITGGSSLAATANGTPKHGSLVIDVDLTRATDVFSHDVQLTNATTEAYGRTFGYGLRSGVLSEVTQAFRINSSIDEADLRFHFWLLAPQSMLLPAGMVLQKFIIAKPNGVSSLGSYSSLDMDYTAGTSLTAGQYLEVQSDVVTVHGGDIVYIAFRRHGESDAVASQLVLINSFGKFEV